jgi:hypothetical protein
MLKGWVFVAVFIEYTKVEPSNDRKNTHEQNIPQ